MPVLIGLALWLASDKMDAMTGGAKPDSSGYSVQAAAPATTSFAPPVEPPAEVVDVGPEYDYVPLVEGRPETAVIYDGIRKVQHSPSSRPVFPRPRRATATRSRALRWR